MWWSDMHKDGTMCFICRTGFWFFQLISVMMSFMPLEICCHWKTQSHYELIILDSILYNSMLVTWTNSTIWCLGLHILQTLCKPYLLHLCFKCYVYRHSLCIWDLITGVAVTPSTFYILCRVHCCITMMYSLRFRTLIMFAP